MLDHIHPAILAILGFLYVCTTLIGFILLAEGIDCYIFYKKKSLGNPNYKAKMTSAKKQSRTGLVLLVFGPFCLLYFILKSIINSIPKRPKSFAIFWDAIKDIFFKF